MRSFYDKSLKINAEMSFLHAYVCEWKNKNTHINMESRVFSNQRPTHIAAVSTKVNVKSHIRWFMLLAVLMLPMVTMGQTKASSDGKDNQKIYVKFVEVLATKTYPDGNQVTYVRATGLPTDKVVADKMEEHLLSVMRLSRIKVYINQDRFLLDGDADINPEWVVDEMNVFLRRYYAEMNQEKE